MPPTQVCFLPELGPFSTLCSKIKSVVNRASSHLPISKSDESM